MSDKPMYQRIMDAIREDIDSGRRAPGDTLPSVNQLAKMFSTSRNTAVKAVSDLASAGVIQCVRGKGSIVAKSGGRAPRRKPAGKSSVPVVGILLRDFDDINHPYLAKILRGISQKARTTPCSLKTFCVDESRAESFLREERFDGLVIVSDLPRESVRRLRRGGTPLVLANNDVCGEDVCSVTVDAFAATCEAIRHLSSLGHRKIAVLSGPSEARSTAISHAAWRQTMKELGLNADERFFRACEYGEEGGRTTFSKMLDGGVVPTAVYALEDHIALGAMRAAGERSLKTPRDLSVIGTGDLLPTTNMKTPLTTFDTRLEEMGGLCLDAAIIQIKGGPLKHMKTTLEARLIVRGSCGRAR